MKNKRDAKKVARSARGASMEFFLANTETRYVRASPADYDSWAGPFWIDGAPYFEVVLVPPLNGWTTWSVGARGNDDTSYYRRGLSEEKARALYAAIQPQTQIRTLRNNHGFRAE